MSSMKYVINIAILCSFSFSFIFLLSCTENNSTDKPNIVLIMADDMGYECIGAYGSTSYKTPNIDNLASQGILFSNCISQPLCTPSRVKIMTGKYNYLGNTHERKKTSPKILEFRVASSVLWALETIFLHRVRDLFHCSLIFIVKKIGSFRSYFLLKISLWYYWGRKQHVTF